MKNDRFRIPVDGAYLTAIGLAIYAFSRLEWNVVWCCEKISPGCINTLGKKTAKGIGDRFIKLGLGHPDPLIRNECSTLGAKFAALVQRRNDLVHGRPGTAEGGAQRLFANGAAWTPEKLETFADDVSECQISASRLFHEVL
jgi:hypothetical protein